MNNCNINIISNNEIIKSNNDIVYLPNESTYSILLENNNNVIIDVFLKIDGKKMGGYRLIPNEKYKINRSIRRKNKLVFLKKKEYENDNLFDKNNKNLGIIEAEFKSGIINLKDNESYNKKIFRPKSKGYFSEYMNIYKNNIKTEKILIKNDSQNEADSCSVESINGIPEYKNEIIDSNECESNGFTAYGEKLNNPFKTYCPLLYDGNKINIKITLKCKKTYIKL